MRALFDGVEGGSLTRFKGADSSLNLMLINDDGSSLDITGDEISIAIYSTDIRNASPVATFEAEIQEAKAGFCTVALAAADMTFGPGTFFMYAERSHVPEGEPPPEPLVYFAASSKMVVK